MNTPQQSTLGLLDALWPNSFRVSSASEANYLVNGPVGDLVDVLADLSDPQSLAQQLKYKVLLLSGNVAWTPAWKSTIWNGFLGNGGWLVLDVNTTHDAIYTDLGKPALAAFVPGHTADQIGVADVLAGHVVRVSSPGHYPALVAELVNNQGIDKTPLAAPVVSEGGRLVTVWTAGGRKIASVKALRSAHPLTSSADLFQVVLEPGDVAIIAVELQ